MIARKSMITFGMVAIPIAMYAATQDNDIHFNQLHKDDNGRIRYKKTCAHCGKEIKTEDIAKGYEYDKDKYVVVTDDEMPVFGEMDVIFEAVHVEFQGLFEGGDGIFRGQSVRAAVRDDH